MSLVLSEQRLKQLETLYMLGPQFGDAVSMETLIDVLICLYDECCSSTLRKEKNVSEFVDFSKQNAVQRIFVHFGIYLHFRRRFRLKPIILCFIHLFPYPTHLNPRKVRSRFYARFAKSRRIILMICIALPGCLTYSLQDG